MTKVLISEARKKFHRLMLQSNILTISEKGIVSNSDSSSASSTAIALRTAEILAQGCNRKINITGKAAGQTLGRMFELLVCDFIRDTFLKLASIRPGKWGITCPGRAISTFTQYEHLAELTSLISGNAQLAAALGNDYVIAPDIVIYRKGRLPHIAVVTGEPMPGRLASIAISKGYIRPSA